MFSAFCWWEILEGLIIIKFWTSSVLLFYSNAKSKNKNSRGRKQKRQTGVCSATRGGQRTTATLLCNRIRIRIHIQFLISSLYYHLLNDSKATQEGWFANLTTGNSLTRFGCQQAGVSRKSADRSANVSCMAKCARGNCLENLPSPLTFHLIPGSKHCSPTNIHHRSLAFLQTSAALICSFLKEVWQNWADVWILVSQNDGKKSETVGLLQSASSLEVEWSCSRGALWDAEHAVRRKWGLFNGGICSPGSPSWKPVKLLRGDISFSCTLAARRGSCRPVDKTPPLARKWALSGQREWGCDQ